MSLGDQIARNLPYLRRYARALTGSQATGDAFVRATLEAALADSELKESLEGGRVPLYRRSTRSGRALIWKCPKPSATTRMRMRRRTG